MALDQTRKQDIHIPSSGGRDVDARILFGGDDVSDYFPTADIEWRGEQTLSLDYTPKKSVTQSHVNGRLKLSNSDEDIEMYSHADGGRFEFSLILKKRPASSDVWKWKIRGGENIDFLRQADPSQTESTTIVTAPNADGILVPSYTWSDREGDHYTPVRMAGGLIGRHKSKRNHRKGGKNYGLGIVCSIETAVFIDANNDTAVGEIEVVGNELIVLPPPGDWIRNAVLPITVDPTLGITDATGSSSSNSSRAWAWEVTPTEDGTIDDLNVWQASGSATSVFGAFYDDTTTAPDNVIEDLGSVSTSTGQFNTITAAGTTNITNGTPFWLAHQFNATNVTNWFTNAASNRGSWGQSPVGTWDDPHGGFDSTNTQDLCTYINYTASGGGGVTIPVLMNSYRRRR